MYRPCNSSDHYNQHMCQLIRHCSRNMTNVISLGDFNLPLIDWSNNVSPITQQYNSLIECISENRLTQHESSLFFGIYKRMHIFCTCVKQKNYHHSHSYIGSCDLWIVRLVAIGSWCDRSAVFATISSSGRIP